MGHARPTPTHEGWRKRRAASARWVSLAGVVLGATIPLGAADAQPAPTPTERAPDEREPADEAASMDPRAAPRSRPSGAIKPGRLIPIGHRPPLVYSLQVTAALREALPQPTRLDGAPQTVRLRVQIDATGAIIGVERLGVSGDRRDDPAFVAAVMATLDTFKPKGARRVPAPRDPKLAALAAGAGIELTLEERPLPVPPLRLDGPRLNPIRATPARRAED